jgi:hypothetical protein
VRGDYKVELSHCVPDPCKFDYGLFSSFPFEYFINLNNLYSYTSTAY